jgi:HemY protein
VIRAIVGVAFVAVLVAAAVFFADHPGRVEILWQGWEIETSVAVLAAAAILAALATGLLLSLLSLIVDTPRRLLHARRESRRRAGYRALSQGMVAVAAGDPQEARRYAKRADLLLADPPLTLLLSAQAAQLDGDEGAAKKFFTAMLERPETEFLGLRGLFNQAMREGDRSSALSLVERAMALRPRTRWVALSRFDLETREGRWEAARETLAQAAKRRHFPPEQVRHHRGVLLYELSCAAVASGDQRRAMALASEAQGLTEDLATPAVHHVRLLLKQQRIGRAAKAVDRAWRTAPHPDLVRAYGAIHEGEPPLVRVKSFERLAAQNPMARESHLALAEAALDAQLWGEARRHLTDALAAGATPRVCQLMARLEESEHGELGPVREWLDRTVGAMPDPRYVCASCGRESLDWHSLCPHCSAFDALSWRTPAWAAFEGNLLAKTEPQAGSEPALAQRDLLVLTCVPRAITEALRERRREREAKRNPPA